MAMNPHKQRHTGNESGIALVILVIVAIPLIGLLCLAFDAGIYLTSAAQLNRSTQNAALAAMSRYLLELDRSNGPTEEGARVIARDQAENVLRANSFVGNSFRMRPATYPPAELGNHTNFHGAEGDIQFGRYYPEILPSTHSDYDLVVGKCGSDATNYPCFAEGLGAPNTAVRVTVHTGTSSASQNPLVPVFGKLLGAPPINLQVKATATRIMQNFSFLVDLSNSVASVNHLRGGIRNDNPWPPAIGMCADAYWFTNPACAFLGSASSFAYQMSEDGVCDDFSSDDPGVCCRNAECLMSSSGEGLPWDDEGSYLGTWTRYKNFWKNQCVNRAQADCPHPLLSSSSPAPSPDDRVGISTPLDDYWQFHPMNDYRPVLVDFGKDIFNEPTGNPRTDGGTLPFLIDFAANSASPPCTAQFCAQPEPLFSILSGVGSAMVEIEERKIPGDRFMFSAFDEFLFRRRVSCEHVSGTPSEECPQDYETTTKLVRPNDASTSEFKVFKDLLSEDALRNPSSGLVVDFLQRGIFPRPLNTDGELALWDAVLEVNRVSTAKLAKNMLFVFTDGHFNCGLEGDFPSIPAYLSNPNHSCASSGAKVWKSLTQLRNFRGPDNRTLVDALDEGKVSVSVFLFGSGSHRILRRSTYIGGGCMTESEAATVQCLDEGGSCFVRSGRYNFDCDYATGECSDETNLNNEFLKLMAGSPSNFYLQNELYEILVKPTRGRWVPILPIIPANVNTSGTAANARSFIGQLDAICNQMAPGQPVLNAPGNASLQILLANGTRMPVTDSLGRLLYDPLGRTPQQQISTVIEEVMDAGFSLIEPKN